jgi:hypothetical protein
MSALADDAHTATHAAPSLRRLFHVSLAPLPATDRVRLRVVPHPHLSRAHRPDRHAPDRPGPDHPRKRRVLHLVALVHQRCRERARRARAETDRGETRTRSYRFAAAEHLAICSQAVVGRKDIDRRCCTRGAHMFFISFSERAKNGNFLSLLVPPVLVMLIFRGACVMLPFFFSFSRALCYIGSRLPLSVSYSLGCLTIGRGEGPICRDSLRYHNNLLDLLAPQ